MAASYTPHIGDRAHDPGVCPAQESNPDLLVLRLMLSHGATPAGLFLPFHPLLHGVSFILRPPRPPALSHPDSPPMCCPRLSQGTLVVEAVCHLSATQVTGGESRVRLLVGSYG